MKVLGLSDIHGNVRAVEKLRGLERNEFDLLVVAGDIGNDAAGDVFEILTSFDCPVLYVFGNWDGRLEYERSFGPTCYHLHMQPFDHDGFAFVGFSGLPVKWGLNPHALRLRADVDARHQGVLDELEGLKSAPAADRAKLERSARYKAFKRDDAAADIEILRANRAELANLVTERGPERAVVVTHQRLTKTQVDLGGVPLFLYGHRHGFEDKFHRGSRFVNVSALDNRVTVEPVDPKAVDWELRNINAGGYAILDIDASETRVTPRHFAVNMDGVVRSKHWRLFAPAVED
jgi:predicted phosphodiesterase